VETVVAGESRSMRKLKDPEIPVTLKNIERDVFDTSMPTLQSKLRALPSAERRRLLTRVRNAMKSVSLQRIQTRRVKFVRLLFALLPDSEHTIRRLFSSRSTSAQLTFTLYCYADDLPYLQGGHALHCEMARFAREYLISVRNDRAFSGWMVAHFLGDHYSRKASARSALLGVLERGETPKARAHAINGLAELAGRSETTRAIRRRILERIKTAAHTDARSDVRESAKHALWVATGGRKRWFASLVRASRARSTRASRRTRARSG
jgi:hypothetical protein